MLRKKKSSDKLPTKSTGSAAKTAVAAPQQVPKKTQTPPAPQPKDPPTAATKVVVAATTATPPAVTNNPPVAPAADATNGPKKVDKAARKAKGAKGFFKRAPTIVGIRAIAAEATRLQEDEKRANNWKRWGPYLSERQWATVREDYSPDGSW